MDENWTVLCVISTMLSWTMILYVLNTSSWLILYVKSLCNFFYDRWQYYKCSFQPKCQRVPKYSNVSCFAQSNSWEKTHPERFAVGFHVKLLWFSGSKRYNCLSIFHWKDAYFLSLRLPDKCADMNNKLVSGFIKPDRGHNIAQVHPNPMLF